MRLRTAFPAATLFLAALAGLPAQGLAASYEVLHAFAGDDGYGANTRLVAGPNGVLYGVTPSGGAINCGTVFSLTPPAAGGTTWTFATLYDFPAWQTACGPLGPLALDAAGVLYGASAGGQFNGGTVFSLTPAKTGGTWNFQVLHDFGDTDTDVENPTGGVVRGANGVLYGGVSYVPGVGVVGAVYALLPPAAHGDPWTDSVVFATPGFNSTTPAPAGSLLYRGGALYGLACGASSNSCAVVSLTPPAGGSGAWQYTPLATLPGPSSGNNTDLIADSAGALYGTTQRGGASFYGDVYRVVPPSNGSSWTYEELYAFPQGGLNGDSPVSGVVFDSKGHLWGTTPSGINAKGIPIPGVIYSLTPPSGAPPWTYTARLILNGSADGGAPQAGLAERGGTLYGVTPSGGGKYDQLFPTYGYSGFGYGTVFGFTP